MKALAKLTILAVIILAVGSASRGQNAQVRVAAASDLTFALHEIAPMYEAKTHNKVRITYGSSGNFFSQIQSGAPFDVFLSADVEFPARLEKAGLTEPGTLRKYAIGEIALWAPVGMGFDLPKQTWHALTDAGVQKIAIANPAHAPYGRAAIAALKQADIYEKVEPKLVYGENISQAAQFVQSGNAQIGILALSLVLSPSMKSGSTWEVPGDMHDPIEQAAVVLKRASDKHAAKAFLDFLTSEQARLVLIDYGFTFPQPAAPARKR
jgi:molybdate transport system substrate-binding protein